MELFTDLSDRFSEQISGGRGNLDEPQTGGFFNGLGNNPHAANNPDTVHPGNLGEPGQGGSFNPNNPHYPS